MWFVVIAVWYAPSFKVPAAHYTPKLQQGRGGGKTPTQASKITPQIIQLNFQMLNRFLKSKSIYERLKSPFRQLMLL